MKFILSVAKMHIIKQDTRIEVDPEKTYLEAILLCKQNKYQKAEEQFNLVLEVESEYPNLQKNIEQCRRLQRAYNVYQTAKKLHQNGEYQEALRKFRYIEKTLQSNFKDVVKQIQDCENQIWITQKKNQADKLNILQLQEIQQKLIEQVKQLQQTLSKIEPDQEGNQKKQPQQKIPKPEANPSVPLPPQKKKIPQNDQEEQELREENIEGELIERVPLYYKSLKTPYCTQTESHFTHKKCQTKAYLYITGEIGCEFKTCRRFLLKNALFSCQSNEVFEKVINLTEDQYEQISSPTELADIVGLSLNKIDESENDKVQFSSQIVTVTMMEFM